MKLLIWKLCKKRWKLELWQNYLVTALSWNCMGISPSNIQQKIPNKWNMTMVRNLTTNHYIGCQCDGVSFDSICTWSLVVMDWVARTLASKQSQYAQMPFSTDAALLLSSSKKFSNIQSLMEVTGSYLSKFRQRRRLMITKKMLRWETYPVVVCGIGIVEVFLEERNYTVLLLRNVRWLRTSVPTIAISTSNGSVSPVLCLMQVAPPNLQPTR